MIANKFAEAGRRDTGRTFRMIQEAQRFVDEASQLSLCSCGTLAGTNISALAKNGMAVRVVIGLPSDFDWSLMPRTSVTNEIWLTAANGLQATEEQG